MPHADIAKSELIEKVQSAVVADMFVTFRSDSEGRSAIACVTAIVKVFQELATLMSSLRSAVMLLGETVSVIEALPEPCF